MDNLEHIAESLRPLAVPITDLVPDQANARKHNDKNLTALRHSLAQFGQVKPIVVRREGRIVLAGNATLECAIALGWDQIAAVFVDVDATTGAQLAIADNRTAELAEWDKPVLADLLGSFEAEDRAALGFTDQDYDALLAGLQPAFTPNTNPQAANGLVDDDAMRDAQGDLNEAINPSGLTKLEVCCPNCAHVFFIDPPQ